jgi:hypothetical protein
MTDVSHPICPLTFNVDAGLLAVTIDALNERACRDLLGALPVGRDEAWNRP